MKKTNIIYWIITLLFSAYMVFSAIPDAMKTKEAVDFVSGHLGFPEYMIRFLGIAKILAVIVILQTGFPHLKEWAYAGLFFDLLGATHAITATDGWHVQIIYMFLPILFLFISYTLYHKRIDFLKIQQNI